MDEALDAIDGPLSDAVVEDPESVEAAMDALTSLQRFFQIDVADALSIVVGFNDTDGD